MLPGKREVIGNFTTAIGELHPVAHQGFPANLTGTRQTDVLSSTA
jgi:hypothetical protein